MPSFAFKNLSDPGLEDMNIKSRAFASSFNCSSVNGGLMYSCVDGRTSFIVNGFAVFCIFAFRFPVVKADKATKTALFPIIPSASMISTLRRSSAGIKSGHPPCAKTYALACARVSLISFFEHPCSRAGSLPQSCQPTPTGSQLGIRLQYQRM